jgi:hypothetical protein
VVPAQFERVVVNGSVMYEDHATVLDGPGTTPEACDRTIRWMESAEDTIDTYVRVTGSNTVAEGPGHQYTLRYWDTTYTLPRGNASAGQTTVFVLNNLVPREVLIRLTLSSVVRNGTFVVNTGSLTGAQGRSGPALVSHTAGYGGLSGKAVSLEPSTGFTFDSAMAAIPD